MSLQLVICYRDDVESLPIGAEIMQDVAEGLQLSVFWSKLTKKYQVLKGADIPMLINVNGISQWTKSAVSIIEYEGNYSEIRRYLREEYNLNFYIRERIKVKEAKIDDRNKDI